jgi:dTDP-4-amino-4,6-dideoxygalactose transaminase
VTSTGARVVFVDSHPELFTIDVDKLEKSVTKKTKAVIAVHLYGLPAEMDKITAIAARHGIHVIEDAAQGHGAKHRGKNIATFGSAAGFSFYPGKNLGAYGVGGCVATNDPDLATRVRMIANHGRIGKYDHEIEGRNSRLDGLQAAILKTKLAHLESWTEARRRNAVLYRKHLGGSGVQLPVEPAHSRHVYHLFVILVDDRDQLQARLKAAGIESGVHYPIALPLLQAYKYLGHTPKDFPVASSQMGRLLSLPMFPELTEEQIILVSETIRKSI